MIDESLLAKVSGLSPADRLELIGKVWDTLSPEDVPVTDGEAHPDDQSPWTEVKASLERLTR